MAHQPTGTHIPAATSPDPAHLLMEAVNHLERAKHMLLAQYPVYGFAKQYLETAQQAVEVLRVLDIDATH